VAHGEDASLWWHGLQHFASADQVVLLWSTRTEPDETPVPVLAGGARR